MSQSATLAVKRHRSGLATHFAINDTDFTYEELQLILTAHYGEPVTFNVNQSHFRTGPGEYRTEERFFVQPENSRTLKQILTTDGVHALINDYYSKLMSAAEAAPKIDEDELLLTDEYRPVEEPAQPAAIGPARAMQERLALSMGAPIERSEPTTSSFGNVAKIGQAKTPGIDYAALAQKVLKAVAVTTRVGFTKTKDNLDGMDPVKVATLRLQSKAITYALMQASLLLSMPQPAPTATPGAATGVGGQNAPVSTPYVPTPEEIAADPRGAFMRQCTANYNVVRPQVRISMMQDSAFYINDVQNNNGARTGWVVNAYRALNDLWETPQGRRAFERAGFRDVDHAFMVAMRIASSESVFMAAPANEYNPTVLGMYHEQDSTFRSVMRQNRWALDLPGMLKYNGEMPPVRSRMWGYEATVALVLLQAADNQYLTRKLGANPRDVIPEELYSPYHAHITGGPLQAKLLRAYLREERRHAAHERLVADRRATNARRIAEGKRPLRDVPAFRPKTARDYVGRRVFNQQPYLFRGNGRDFTIAETLAYIENMHEAGNRYQEYGLPSNGGVDNRIANHCSDQYANGTGPGVTLRLVR